MAHPDLEELMNVLLPFAKQMLADHGGFYPFAGSMSPDGTISHVGAETGDEQPKSSEVMDLLLDGLREKAREGDLRAAGLCVDVLVTPPGKDEKQDAVSIRLEHESGEAVNVFVPYHLMTDGSYDFNELFATRWEAQIFDDYEA